MRIAHIINGGSSKARNAFKAIEPQLHVEYSSFFTNGIGSACEIASDCLKENYTHLAVLGGDGTLNEVFNAMMNSGKTADELPILIVHPCGTGNDFARNFHFTSDSNHFFQLLKDGRITYTDGGYVQITHAHGQKQERFFLNAMDIGLGGLIAQRVNRYRRGRLSFLSYQRSILRTLPFYRKKQVIVKTSSVLFTGHAMSVVVANGKWFGNGLGIAPEAEVLDGRLECVVLANVTLWDYLLNVVSMMQCRPIIHPEVHYSSVTEITIEGEPQPIELDGEYVGIGNVEIRCIPQAVRLLF